MIKFLFLLISSIIGLPLLFLFLFMFPTIHSEDFINDRWEKKMEYCSTLDDEEQYGLHEGQTQKDDCIEDMYIGAPIGYFLIYIMGVVGFLFSLPFIFFLLRRLYRLFQKIKN